MPDDVVLKTCTLASGDRCRRPPRLFFEPDGVRAARRWKRCPRLYTARLCGRPCVRRSTV
uniref:Uncharacterized protein n=1 Tax=Streptomyces lasalocidi TaxID=324833 RepID=B6ZK60_STRLS|nr:hypothetical protein [Streptomyces lasalocidi]